MCHTLVAVEPPEARARGDVPEADFPIASASHHVRYRGGRPGQRGHPVRMTVESPNKGLGKNSTQFRCV